MVIEKENACWILSDAFESVIWYIIKVEPFVHECFVVLFEHWVWLFLVGDQEYYIVSQQIQLIFTWFTAYSFDLNLQPVSWTKCWSMTGTSFASAIIILKQHILGPLEGKNCERCLILILNHCYESLPPSLASASLLSLPLWHPSPLGFSQSELCSLSLCYFSLYSSFFDDIVVAVLEHVRRNQRVRGGTRKCS